MKITAQEEYGLRCLLQIALLTKSGGLASLNDIAEAEGISIDYAAKLLMVLRQTNLVESIRGQSGGYRLTKPPEKIYLDQVICSLSGKLFESDLCGQFPGIESKCIHINCCSIRSVWLSISRIMFNLFKQITLKDLLEKENLLTRHLKRELVLGLGA